MRKRFGSFILVIQLGVMLLCSTAIAENSPPVLDTGQSLQQSTSVAAQTTDKAQPPVERKYPAPTEVKYLPPEETDERKKLQSRWLRKDESGDNYNRFSGTATMPKKHEIPRRLRLPGTFYIQKKSVSFETLFYFLL